MWFKIRQNGNQYTFESATNAIISNLYLTLRKYQVDVLTQHVDWSQRYNSASGEAALSPIIAKTTLVIRNS